ncbi:MAG TPA: endonuclease/exonuclease/phosphatase family protein [Pyrinomonadaceae bacterium]|nr:endonuclease/exonuclease/phosphatase family protein [Pyrinomonadaceae bacterium]
MPTIRSATLYVVRLGAPQLLRMRALDAARLFLVAGLMIGATAGIVNAQSLPAEELKVMTWNVAGGRCGTDRSMSPFAQVIRAHRPDVVAVQEIHRDQASRLGTATGLNVYFVETQDCRNLRPDFGLAILSRQPFIESSKNVYLLPNHPADSRRGEFRKLIAVNIPVNGGSIRIYNTHLTASARFLNVYRIAQALRIRSIISADPRNSGEAIGPILMGDFNSQPGTLVYRILTGLFRDANPNANTLGRTRVDYIFVGGRILRIDAAGVLNTGSLSDHRPVIARLSFTLLDA